MLVTPGPAFVLIPIGLAMLALEFNWAERLLEKALEQAEKARVKAANTSTDAARARRHRRRDRGRRGRLRGVQIRDLGRLHDQQHARSDGHERGRDALVAVDELGEVDELLGVRERVIDHEQAVRDAARG